LAAVTLEQEIIDALQRAFPEASHLEVINESASHAVPRGSETHFRIILVSKRFEAMPRLSRHRAIQDAIAPQAARAKAIALRPTTPQEWAQGLGGDGAPSCRGG
jgi:stress-induced morphogen